MARALPVLGLDPERSMEANAALIIPVRISELLAWERYIKDPRRVPELHEMRIAAKRLRYTLEIFAPFFAPGLKQAIDQIKGVQEFLGKIHDADVLVPELARHMLAALPRGKASETIKGVYSGDYASAQGLLTLILHRQEEREELYRKFLAGWGRLRAEQFFEQLNSLVKSKGTP